MALTVYAFHAYPHDFAVTKIGAPLEECSFLLDFSRELERVRRFRTFGMPWGPAIGWMVPVVHVAQESGEFVVGVARTEPYFADLPKLWKQHRGFARELRAPAAGGLEIVADFGRHFAEDCQ